jgi:hypothetical protein
MKPIYLMNKFSSDNLDVRRKVLYFNLLKKKIVIIILKDAVQEIDIILRIRWKDQKVF